MSGVEVILEDLRMHPECPHGPTILFSRLVGDKKRNFFACSACRDRKQCTFFMWQDERNKSSTTSSVGWGEEIKQFLKNMNHRKLFLIFHKMKSLPVDKRVYCRTCSHFQLEKYVSKHAEHDLLTNLTDYQLGHPSELMKPLDNPKKEAQYFFTKQSVQALMSIFKELKYKHIICLGTPRIHEHIQSECPEMTSLLVDMDGRYHDFCGPLEFCWYNMFNNHFFNPEGKNVFNDYLQSDHGDNVALVIDPPFGGRVEVLGYVLDLINVQFQDVNELSTDLPMFWIFPYFMAPQIANSLPKFRMLDYKVDYENHSLFQSGAKGRKHGSPIRIFTNVNPSLIALPISEGYKHCRPCNRWVYAENQHCDACNACTSLDGRTYVHCNECARCVKPSWQHCDTCKRCCHADHTCGELAFTKKCFHCKQPGHKKRECPEIDQDYLFEKRKKAAPSAGSSGYEDDDEASMDDDDDESSMDKKQKTAK